MKTLIHERVEQAREGNNPKVIRRVNSGWVVIGDVQFLKGYCLLLPDPVVPSLNDLRGKERETFLRELVLLGDAVLKVTKAKRINYEILGNTEPALHAHVFPRYETESDLLKMRPVWFYDWRAAPLFDRERDAPFMARLKAELDILIPIDKSK